VISAVVRISGRMVSPNSPEPNRLCQLAGQLSHELVLRSRKDSPGTSASSLVCRTPGMLWGRAASRDYFAPEPASGTGPGGSSDHVLCRNRHLADVAGCVIERSCGEGRYVRRQGWSRLLGVVVPVVRGLCPLFVFWIEPHHTPNIHGEKPRDLEERDS